MAFSRKASFHWLPLLFSPAWQRLSCRLRPLFLFFPQLQELVLKQEGVLALDDIKTRQFGSRYFVDVEIACDGDLSLREAHAIASRVHDEIEHHFPETKHCLVHVNPYGEEH